MFKTKDARLCFLSIEEYIQNIQHQLHQCNERLTEQTPSCPESLSIPVIDQRLKEYVDAQQKHFRRKIDHQLSKFKENIHAKQLEDTLSNDSLPLHQVGHRYFESFPSILCFLFTKTKERNPPAINDDT